MSFDHCILVGGCIDPRDCTGRCVEANRQDTRRTFLRLGKPIDTPRGASCIRPDGCHDIRCGAHTGCIARGRTEKATTTPVKRKLRASGYALITPKNELLLVVPEIYKEQIVRDMWKQAFPNKILFNATDQVKYTREAVQLGWRVVPVLIKETTGEFDATGEIEAEAGTAGTGKKEVLDSRENKD